MFPVEFRIVSVFYLLGDTLVTIIVSLWVLSVYFPMLLYVHVDHTYRSPCSVSWCRPRSTENLDSGLSPSSVVEMVGQRILFTHQSVEAWEQFPTLSS